MDMRVKFTPEPLGGSLFSQSSHCLQEFKRSFHKELFIDLLAGRSFLCEEVMSLQNQTDCLAFPETELDEG